MTSVTRQLDAVLLDRDGTINVKAAEGDYITSPEQLRLLPGAGAAIRQLNEAEIPALVITNQRGIALGRMDEADLEAVHTRLYELLAAESGARVDGIFYCPHDSDACTCRKPGIGLLLRARAHLGLSTLRRTVMIGDSLSDVQAGRRAGTRTVLLGPPGRAPRGTATAPSLRAAVSRQLAPAAGAGTLSRGRAAAGGAADSRRG